MKGWIMNQLIMRWKNDGKPMSFPPIPENCRVVNFTNVDNPVEKWLDIVQYGLSHGRRDEDYYHKMMTSCPNYRQDKCFFLEENGKAIATITVICDYEKKEGYIHMVACHENVRGKGYGTLLNKIALFTLKSEGMATAYLTTDDLSLIHI